MTIIRTLSARDSLKNLVTLSKQFFQDYQVHHPTFFGIDTMTEDHVQTYFSRFYQDPDAAAYIALEDELPDSHIIGYLTVYIKPQADCWSVKQVGGISGLMVAEEYRRRGIATQLLDHAKSFLNKKGIRYFTVYTAVANQEALAFYLANGLNPLQTTLLGIIDPGIDL